MTTIELKSLLEMRVKALTQRIREEEIPLRRALHKSRRVRQMVNRTIGRRKDYYVDRRNELELVISLIDGQIETASFVTNLAGDEADRILTAIGNVGIGN